MTFKNTAKPIDLTGKKYGCPGDYGYDRPSPYLRIWSRYFQALVSQAGTYLLTKKFHTQECGIYKSEGGCRIDGVNELVLCDRSCYYNYGGRDEKSEAQLKQLSGLITKLVLEFDPNDPLNSLRNTASGIIGVTPDVLEAAIVKASVGGVFGGDGLSRFFDRNPFDTTLPDQEYEFFAKTKILGQPEKEVRQQQADRQLGEELLKKIQKKYRESNPGKYSVPLCCSPSRRDDGSLMFWINTGTRTALDGWVTEKQINTYLKGNGKL